MSVQSIGEMGKNFTPIFFQPFLENIDRRSCNDGSRELIAVFHNPQWNTDPLLRRWLLPKPNITMALRSVPYSMPLKLYSFGFSTFLSRLKFHWANKTIKPLNPLVKSWLDVKITDLAPRAVSPGIMVDQKKAPRSQSRTLVSAFHLIW